MKPQKRMTQNNQDYLCLDFQISNNNVKAKQRDKLWENKTRNDLLHED